MNEQVEKLLADVSVETFTIVARGALGDDSAEFAGEPTFTEITTSHNDKRTIGIVKVSGSAVSVRDGSHHEWSSVVKIIDTGVKITGGDTSRWVSPEIEQIVYENKLFNGETVPFRSARCYLSDSTSDQLITLWLEDLSNAPQPPWKLENFASAANHLGQFNGDLAVNPVELPFEIANDMFSIRWDPSQIETEAQGLLTAKDSPYNEGGLPGYSCRGGC